ncbi:hypothetical protein FRC17_000685 [Serendipita sp. 399]|nr:hypothetical protein FRC17_000685 [Serendipita sp. 399]
MHKRTKQLLAPPELQAVHPMGKSPVIIDGDLMVAESGAITEYLPENYSNGRFQPPQTKEARLKNSYCLSKASLMPVMNAIKARLVTPNLVNAANMIENDLEESESGWFAGGPEPTL